MQSYKKKCVFLQPNPLKQVNKLNMAEEKSTFGSRLGVILAAAGSAVGLGNVWRFPTEVGQGGGAAFILIYIFFMLVLGVPVMISELAIGRHGQKNVSHSFFTMSGNSRPWAYMGWYPVIAGILVLSYYAVVAGWTLEYAYQAAINGFAGKSAQQYAADFGAFSSDVFSPILYLAFILVLTESSAVSLSCSSPTSRRWTVARCLVLWARLSSRSLWVSAVSAPTDAMHARTSTS